MTHAVATIIFLFGRGLLIKKAEIRSDPGTMTKDKNGGDGRWRKSWISH